MFRNIILWIVVFFFLSLINICWGTYADEPEWKIYDSDEIATHYYLFKGMRSLGESSRGVWVRIIPKGPNKLLLKEIYAKSICEGMDFSDLVEIKCSVEINCLNGKYRVVGGLFEIGFLTTICEPPHEVVKWNDIPLGSPIEKLSKIICPK